MIILLQKNNCKNVLFYATGIKKNHNPLNSCNQMTKKSSNYADYTDSFSPAANLNSCYAN